MECEICLSEFDVSNKGSGGKNRKICFDCLPEGLSKKDRESLKYKLIRDKVGDYKTSLGCAECGYSRCSKALERHHPDNNKELDVSDALKLSMARYIEESSKCTLLCANCHREVHV